MKMIFTLDELETTAKEFLRRLHAYKVFAFSGDLGAGKTTFISALCKQLGVTDKVTSPTYSLIQEYTGKDRLIVYHMDLYRVKNKEEAIDAGIEDCLYSDEICMVEWPEKAPALFPDETVYVTFETISAIKRKMIVTLPR